MVKVTVPRSEEITVSVPPQGVFYHVTEKTHESRAITVPKLPPPSPKPEKDPLDF